MTTNNISATEWTVLDEFGSTVTETWSVERACAAAIAEFERCGGTYTVHAPGEAISKWVVQHGAVFAPRSYHHPLCG